MGLSEAVKELMKHYGRPSLIPQEELAAVGYEAVTGSGGITLIPIGSQVTTTDNGVFGELHFVLPGSEKADSVRGNKLDVLLKKWKEFDYRAGLLYGYLIRDEKGGFARPEVISPEIGFMAEYLKERYGVNPERFSNRLSSMSLLGSLTEGKEDGFEDRLLALASTIQRTLFTKTEGEGAEPRALKEDDANKVLELTRRMQNIFNDPDYLRTKKAVFDTTIAHDLYLEDHIDRATGLPWEPEDALIVALLKDFDFNTLTYNGLYITLAADALAHYGLEDVAQGMRGFSDPDKAVEYLRGLRNSNMPSYQDYEETKRYVGKDCQDEERKTAYKDAKRTVDTQMSTVKKAADFLSAPDTYLNTVKYAMNAFIKAIGVRKGEKHYVLDGQPDAEKDADPGKMSGDCTEGKPLPFYRQDTHNVKVYTNGDGRAYVGNIYLLETRMMDRMAMTTTDERVWHLDAIQIPNGGDWTTGIESLVRAIGTEAAKQGVAYITVNDSKEHISNYDFIQNGVEAFSERQGYQTIQIDIPQDKEWDREENNMSGFQGDGSARIIWANPELASLEKRVDASSAAQSLSP